LTKVLLIYHCAVFFGPPCIVFMFNNTNSKDD